MDHCEDHNILYLFDSQSLGKLVHVIIYEGDKCGRNSPLHLTYIYFVPILDLTHIVLGTEPQP